MVHKSSLAIKPVDSSYGERSDARTDPIEAGAVFVIDGGVLERRGYIDPAASHMFPPPPV
jgi:hypothetical protein